jgi:hypothetical protein
MPVRARLPVEVPSEQQDLVIEAPLAFIDSVLASHVSASGTSFAIKL